MLNIDTPIGECYNITIMLFPPLKSFAYALMAVLLWSQFSLVDHCSEHFLHESVEACEVFNHADESADLSASLEQASVAYTVSKKGFASNTPVGLYSPELRSARAPPLHII